MQEPAPELLAALTNRHRSVGCSQICSKNNNNNSCVQMGQCDKVVHVLAFEYSLNLIANMLTINKIQFFNFRKCSQRPRSHGPIGTSVEGISNMREPTIDQHISLTVSNSIHWNWKPLTVCCHFALHSNQLDRIQHFNSSTVGLCLHHKWRRNETFRCFSECRMHIRCALELSTCRRIEFRKQHETKINVCFEFHAQTSHTVVSHSWCYKWLYQYD